MSSRTSFAAGGLVAAFLMGVLLVASLACEGGDPTSSGSGITGPCSDFLGAYVIASQDGVVTAEVAYQVTDPVTDAKSDFEATSKGWANLVIVAFELKNSPNNETNCSKVTLTAPNGTTTTTLINSGENFSPETLITEDVTTFYNANGAGTYIIEVSTASAPCTGTTTLSNAWLNVVDTTVGSCCDCNNLDGSDTCSPYPASKNCCWGKGDWGMSVVLDPAGVIDTDTNTADILVVLSPVPYGGIPGDLFYVFSTLLDCSTGDISGVDDSLCASISGTINPAGGSSGTLTLEDCSLNPLCTSDWNDNPLGDEVCDWDTECFLCEPLGTPLGTSDDATASPQLRESPVLQRLRRGR